MKKHKWKTLIDWKNKKTQECEKCGVFREWLFGDMQCWVYTYLGSRKEYVKRPDCNRNENILTQVK